MLNGWLTRVPQLRAEEIENLRGICHSVASILHTEGLRTPALSSDPAPWEPDIYERIEKIRIYSEILTAHHMEGRPMRDHKALLWKFLTRMGLTPTSDLMDVIQDEDIIEVYNMNNYQIFRNLNYFDYVSMSVE